MSVDIAKQLDKAKRFVEKNRIDDAIEAYQSVLSASPNHLESMQSLGDLLTKQNEPDRAAFYYGMLFDRFATPREDAKALALYARFLKPHEQPPERISRYALLLQKQNRGEEAIEQFTVAAISYERSSKGEDALTCLVRIAQIDSENRDRHIALAALAERLGNRDAAAKGYLRAGQLTTQNDAEAIELFAKAYKIDPNDRSMALMYAQALLRKGEAAAAAALLAPLSENEKDVAFIETYTDALMRSGQFDALLAVLERMPDQGAASTEKLFTVAAEILRTGQEDKAIDLLGSAMKKMIAARRESQLATAIDRLVEAYPKSLRLAQFWAAMYADLNREAKYFDATVRLFDLYLAEGLLPGACESLEKLVEIDPYDARNQGRLDQLKGRADDAFLRRLGAQLSNVATNRSEFQEDEGQQRGKAEESSAPKQGDAQSGQSLEDLLVQAEIFVQYSLQSKAVERLQRIVELFPGEVQGNERLQGLFEATRWRPAESAARRKPGESSRPAVPEPAGSAAANITYAPETLRDLAKISEINQNVFRQPSPRAMLSVTVNDVGNYVRATRCLVVVGAPGQPPQMASEYCSSGIKPSTGSQIMRLIGLTEQASPDGLGGLTLEAITVPHLTEMGLETTLGVQLTDPETQSPGGMIIVGFAGSHAWKSNETYFLQSIGDQMLMCVHHTRLRMLVRTLAVADEKTGLLARGSYIDCLLRESQRARTQGIPLTLALLQIDGGPELLRQQGEGPFDRHMEQVGKAVQSIIRQTDLAIKYTSWALAVVLPDTPLSGARVFAEKMKKSVGALSPPWAGVPLTMSVAIAEAVARADYDSEDIVTDLINRVETGLDEARKGGGNRIIGLEMAKN
jgi:diguanylate cyclase (GGDEF)-like protein